MLTVEELLSKKRRRKFTLGHTKVFPNQKLSTKEAPLLIRLTELICGETFSENLNLWWKAFQFRLWGGDRYDTRTSIEKVLYAYEVHVCIIHKLLL